jgi:hypothetical protein
MPIQIPVFFGDPPVADQSDWVFRPPLIKIDAVNDAANNGRTDSIRSATFDALIDTGADCCIVDPSVLAHLSLSSSGTGYDVGMHGAGETGRVQITLALPSANFTYAGLLFVKLLRPSQHFDILLGRDFLQYFKMDWDGQRQTMRLWRD